MQEGAVSEIPAITRIKRAPSKGESFHQFKESAEFEQLAARHVTPSVLLCAAASVGDIDQLKEILALPSVDVNEQDYDGRSALHLAADEGHADCVRLLIEHGANVNATDKHNSTPLRGALTAGQEEVGRILQQHGALLSRNDATNKVKSLTAVLEEERLEEARHVFEKLANQPVTEGDERADKDITVSTEALNGYLNQHYGMRPKRIAALRHDIESLDENGTVRWRKFTRFAKTNAGKEPLLQKALTGRVAIPDWKKFTQSVQQIFRDVVEDCKGYGTPSSYLAEQHANDVGLCIVTVDGQRFSIGDAETGFPISACGLPLLYSLCLEELGAETIANYCGREPSGEGSNSFELNEHKRPHNPLNPAGGIVLSSLYHPKLPMTKRFKHLKTGVKAFAGNEHIGFSQTAYLNKKDSGYQYFALGNFMKAEESLPEGSSIPNTVDLYLQMNSLEVSCIHLAIAAATFANNGVCPVTDNRVLHHDNVKNVLQVMYSCGMYDYSGEWACTIGIPAKSGTSGCIFLVIPSLLGLCVWAPPLDENRNSYAGTEFCRRFAQAFRWSIFDVLYASNRH